MKHTYTKVLFGALLIGAFLMPEMVEGKSVSWSTSSIPRLWYHWNWGGGPFSANGNTGWQPGLQPNASVQLDYNAVIKNADTGAIINDGATLPVGTKITYEVTHNNSDVSWNGTGLSSDSPNGHWTANAEYPSDSTAGDRVADSIQTGSSCLIYITTVYQTADVYVPFSIKIPSKAIAFSGTAAVNQINATTWEILSAGTVALSVNFSQTYGKFYYYYVTTDYICPGGTFNNQVAMTIESSLTQTCKIFPFIGNQCGYFGDANPPGSVPSYQLTVPQQSITFNLIAVSSNNNPNPPSLTGPTTGSTNTNYPFTTQASDMDGDQVRYGIDWDNNNTVDEWTAYVASNIAVNTNHQWATPGTYTLKALTQDSKSAVSGWSAPLTITIQTIVNGACGAANGFPTTNPPAIGLCFSGTPTAVTPGVAPGPYSWTCLGSGGGTNSPVCTAPYLPPAPNFNFQINGVVANGSLTVARNANLNIIFNGVTNATSCTGSGNSWTGAKVTTGGNDNISATAASLYQLSCTGPGGTMTKNISVTLQPTLKICQNSCSSSIEPPVSFSMNRFDTRNLVACYNDATSCTDGTGDVTTGATWTEGGGNPVSLGGTSPKTLTADNVGTESIQATYSGNTVTRSVTVTCTDSGACQRDSRSQSLCQKDNFTVVDNCGVTQNCTGEKTCDYNWKEVVP